MLALMDWREPVIDYCERQSGAFWAEPLNALSNAAFLLAAAAALTLWRRQEKADYPALALILATAAVGVGSFIFHTVATRGAMLLDVIPISLFIYGYFLLTLRRMFGLETPVAVGITLLFALGSYRVDGSIKGLNGSAGYLPALAALAVFAALLWGAGGSNRAEIMRRRRAAAGLTAAASLFLVSLVFRTIDRDICAAFPPGVHFVWHVLNAVVLWLLLRTAILAGPRAAA